MKNKFIGLSILSFFVLSCEENNTAVRECVRVKVVKELCGQAILEILDPAYYDHGQSWEDGEGVQYEHVFSTILPCHLMDNFKTGAIALEPGEELLIQFTDQLYDNNCPRCEALLIGPDKFSYIIDCFPLCGID